MENIMKLTLAMRKEWWKNVEFGKEYKMPWCTFSDVVETKNKCTPFWLKSKIKLYWEYDEFGYRHPKWTITYYPLD